MGPQDYTQPNELGLLISSIMVMTSVINNQWGNIYGEFVFSIESTWDSENREHYKYLYYKASFLSEILLKWLATQTPTTNLQFWKQLACVAGGFVWVSWRARAIQNSQPRGQNRDW